MRRIEQQQPKLRRKQRKDSLLNSQTTAFSNFIKSKWHSLVNQGNSLLLKVGNTNPLSKTNALNVNQQNLLLNKKNVSKSTLKSNPTLPLGLFRQLCVSAVAGELIFHFNALRNGEEDYPLMIMIDKRNHLIQFPGLRQISTYINN